jgi:hypothetical protein
MAPLTAEVYRELCRRLAAQTGDRVATVDVVLWREGLLYKIGERKDCDLLFYRVRQWKCVDFTGLLEALAKIGCVPRVVGAPRWCVKATYRGRAVDQRVEARR